MTFTTRKFLTVATFTVAMAMTASYAAAQDKAQIKKGQDVYNAQKCQTCHAIGGKGAKQNPLDGVGKKITADETRQWILNPTEMSAKIKSEKKPPMPAKYKALPAADLDALVAYLQSL